MTLEKFSYDNKIVRNFALATMVWGIVAMLVGLLAALQLPFPGLNFDAHTTFGRIRPLHTNAIIFAFVGNGMFMGVYYSLQRLMKARMFSDLLSKIHFWGWQLIIPMFANVRGFQLAGQNYARTVMAAPRADQGVTPSGSKP